MYEDALETALLVIATIILIAFLGAISWTTSYFKCGARADMMNMNHSWGPLQGCMVEYKPNKWINIERYRAVD